METKYLTSSLLGGEPLDQYTDGGSPLDPKGTATFALIEVVRRNHAPLQSLWDALGIVDVEREGEERELKEEMEELFRVCHMFLSVPFLQNQPK
jgi:hypothetical protein